jgi:hypothetical protein
LAISSGAEDEALVFTGAGAAAQAFSEIVNARPSLVDQVSCVAAWTRIGLDAGLIAVEESRVKDRPE